MRKPNSRINVWYKGSKRPFNQRELINYTTLDLLRRNITKKIGELGIEKGLDAIKQGVPLKDLIDNAFDKINEKYSKAQVNRYKKALSLEKDVVVRIYRGKTRGRPWMVRMDEQSSL